MSEKRRVLIVDDEPGMLDVAQMYFNREGFQVLLAIDGETAIEMMDRERLDLVVLDLMLPKLDGFEVCRKIRQISQVPIIILTARDEEVDKIVGLELGADDYLTKPFSPRELVARTKAVLRRSDSQKPSPETPEEIQLGELSLCKSSRIASASGEILDLSPKEFDLLWTLASRPFHVLDRDWLIEQVWGYDFPGGTRTVDMHVAQLRKKMAAAGLRNPAITTVHSIGYRLDME
jgi:DNA-binding response OmpR family regulator